MEVLTPPSNRVMLFFAAALLFCAPALLGQGAQLGDGGHFFRFHPPIYLNNPEGVEFTVTVHRHHWHAERFNQGVYEIEVLNPSGESVARGTIPSGQPRVTLSIPAGEPGVYRVEMETQGYALTWVETSLPEMTMAAKPFGEERQREEGWRRDFILHAMTPRRWFFFVPEGTESFEVRHTILPFQSHRENYGLLVMNPLGQRVAAFYGGREEHHRPPLTLSQTIHPDAGTTGRFWSLWVTGGDSHNFATLSLQLAGIPPWVSQAPEQWFDPETGDSAPRLVYDTSEVRQDGRDGSNFYTLAPAPFLGSDGYNGLRGPQVLYLQNPESRPLRLGVTTYITSETAALPAALRAFAPSGDLLAEAEGTFKHRENVVVDIPDAGPGVYRVEVDAENWYPWQEPAVPIVLQGRGDENHGTFAMEIGIPRHWYFLVPEGTRSFQVEVELEGADDALLVEVHAPDRCMAVQQVTGGSPATLDILVPPNRDGMIWFLRTEVGSAARMISGQDPRQLRIPADITLRGVPPFLAPTFEQWFDPGIEQARATLE